ncbi:MAG: DUF6922 domain-containing protein [Bacteroidia bacterium]
MQNFISSINPRYFWDVNTTELDPLKSKRFIIERVLTLGNLKEVKLVLAAYGKPEVIQELCKLNYLDPKTLQFVSVLFGIPKNKFKCYKRKPLTHQHWS